MNPTGFGREIGGEKSSGREVVRRTFKGVGFFGRDHSEVNGFKNRGAIGLVAFSSPFRRCEAGKSLHVLI